jgi:transposase-like protein
MNELKNRHVEDVLITIVDGLKGFPEAITAASRKQRYPFCGNRSYNFLDDSLIAVNAW